MEHKNSSSEIKKFKFQLTFWMLKYDIHKFTAPFYQEHGPTAYGKYFIVKKKIGEDKYAVFTDGGLMR